MVEELASEIKNMESEIAPSVLCCLCGAMIGRRRWRHQRGGAFRSSIMSQDGVVFHSVHQHQASQSPYHTIEFEGVQAELLDQLYLLDNLKKDDVLCPTGQSDAVNQYLNYIEELEEQKWPLSRLL